MTISTQDRELVSILEDLKILTLPVTTTVLERVNLKAIFVRRLFNLNKKGLTEAEIKVLKKGLDYAPIQNKVNEPEFRSDFEEFCRMFL